jgi:hypothetical protein
MLNQARLDVLERNADAGNAEFINWALHKLSDREQLEYARKMKKDSDRNSSKDSSLPSLSLVIGTERGNSVLQEIDSDRVMPLEERLASPAHWFNPTDHQVLYRRR